ncbi:LicD family protein [Litorisediminicola beolgyonensis]|uniref:LicD family protein n=1 Tax=Litorisediminicola beolgyonensis TaxID=1173614 RepID=A0ABW3ZJU0_9RHOB
MTRRDARRRVREIAAMAKGELAFGRTGLDFRKLSLEVLDLRANRGWIEWLEAAVATAVIARSRPARTVRFLSELRERHEQDGKPELFEAFETLINDYLAPEKLTNHGYTTATFDSVDHAPIWSGTAAAIAAVEATGHQVFLNSGTLLGVVRDGRLIDHDDDIDLAVILKATTDADAASEWRALAATLAETGALDPEGKRIAGLLKLRGPDGVEVDLFPAWFVEGRLQVYPHTRGELTEEQVLPLVPCPITGHARPRDAEAMLAVNYGEGWRTPDPFFKFDWPRARRVFAPFLKAI